MQDKLDDLKQRQEQAFHAGSPRSVERQHEKGKMLARERLEYFLDDGSFHELDLLARHRAHAAGLEERPYTDGVITGWGTVEGRKVFVFSPGLHRVRRRAGRGVRREDPQADGPRAQGRRARSSGSTTAPAPASRRASSASPATAGSSTATCCRPASIPQISVILGPCAGGAVYSPAMTDFIFMVRESSHMFITGPDVVKTVTGEDVTLEELGGAMSHASKSGVATFVSADEKSCLDDVRFLLSFLPQNNLEEPPVEDLGDDPDRLCPELRDILPPSPNHAVRHERGDPPRRRRRRVLRVLPALGEVDRVRVLPHRRAARSASSATSR